MYRQSKVGPSRARGGAATPCLARLTRLHLVGLLVGLECSHGGVWPKFVSWMVRLLFPWHRICFTLCLKAHFDYNSIVSKYKCCKIEVLQYKWNYVNSKGICM
jgi:hypothetical protein